MRVILVVTLLAMAGCASSPSDTSSTDPQKQYDDGGANRLDVPVLPKDPPGPGERTLAAAPQWRLGEYWVIETQDHFTGNTFRATRVVAGTDGGNYLVGFPVGDFSNDMLIFHIPGVGDISRADLSFEVHDVRYTPLRFPLVQGDVWQSSFEGRDVNVTVESVTGTMATLTAQGPGTNITMLYDAEMGEVRELTYPNYADYKVIEHGYGFQGVVRVPHAHDLIFIHGRVAGVTEAGSGGVNFSQVDTIEVDASYDRASFILAVGSADLVPLDNALGYYRETATAPDGTVYQVEANPTSPLLQIVPFGVDNPAGTWTVEHIAAGPGIAFIEGIGYHSIDVDLPSGCVVESFNAQHHQNQEKCERSA